MYDTKSYLIRQISLTIQMAETNCDQLYIHALGTIAELRIYMLSHCIDHSGSAPPIAQHDFFEGLACHSPELERFINIFKPLSAFL